MGGTTTGADAAVGDVTASVDVAVIPKPAPSVRVPLVYATPPGELALPRINNVNAGPRVIGGGVGGGAADADDGLSFDDALGLYGGKTGGLPLL